jgi:hypothetical protein
MPAEIDVSASPIKISSYSDMTRIADVERAKSTPLVAALQSVRGNLRQLMTTIISAVDRLHVLILLDADSVEANLDEARRRLVTANCSLAQINATNLRNARDFALNRHLIDELLSELAEIHTLMETGRPDHAHEARAAERSRIQNAIRNMTFNLGNRSVTPHRTLR